MMPRSRVGGLLSSERADQRPLDILREGAISPAHEQEKLDEVRLGHQLRPLRRRRAHRPFAEADDGDRACETAIVTLGHETPTTRQAIGERSAVAADTTVGADRTVTPPRNRLLRLIRASDAGFIAVQFALSRLIYLAGGLLTIAIQYGMARAAVTFNDVIGLGPQVAGSLLYNGDSAWYASIVHGGYLDAQYSPSVGLTNWAFFPLYPLLVRLTGGSDLAGILIANLALLAACSLLSYELRVRHSRTAARWTILFLLYWPLSGLLSSYRPDSLVLLGSVVAWVAAGRQRWSVAWVGVAIATMARPTGALAGVLVMARIFAALRESGWSARTVLRPLSGAIIPIAGLVTFAAYMGLRTGDPLVFADMQAVWGRMPLSPEALIAKYWANPMFILWSWDFAAFNWLVLAAGCLTGIRLAQRRSPGLAAFTLLSILVSPITGGSTIALGRYATAAFPLFMEPAMDRRLRGWRLGLLMVSTALLALVGAWIILGSEAVIA